MVWILWSVACNTPIQFPFLNYYISTDCIHSFIFYYNRFEYVFSSIRRKKHVLFWNKSYFLFFVRFVLWPNSSSISACVRVFLSTYKLIFPIFLMYGSIVFLVLFFSTIFFSSNFFVMLIFFFWEWKLEHVLQSYNLMRMICARSISSISLMDLNVRACTDDYEQS